MFETLGNLLGRKGTPQTRPVISQPCHSEAAPPALKPNGGAVHAPASERKPMFSKVFRWRLPNGQTQAPAAVEVAGSFTHWQKVPLVRDGGVDAWHVTLHNLQNHRTHHYMLFIDGKPTFDRHCDGLAVPHGPDEESAAVPTAKGPRVMMLFAQTK